MNPRQQRPETGARRRWWRRRSTWLCVAVVLLWPLAVLSEAALDWLWPYPLDRLRALPVSTVVTAADGSWLVVAPTPAGERVLPLSWRDAPTCLQQAVLAGEDARFFDHGGVDALAVLRACASNLASRRIVSGASTLTMQVVRLVEPRPRTIASKVVELLRARQLERSASKEEIASVWLTQVPMGGTLRGFAAASRSWFGKTPAELDAVEAATLVAMVPAPSARSPSRWPQRVLPWRDRLLRLLAERGVLSADALAAALARPVDVTPVPWPWRAGHAATAALRALGPGPRPAQVATAIDVLLQRRLETAAAGWGDLPGDGLAVVVLGRDRGDLLALLGDRDPRAPLDLSQCRRSVGSTLKPFLYSLAHQHGAIGEATLLADAPVQLGNWRPANFHRTFGGRTRAAEALATSSNLVAVRCLEQVGVASFAALLEALGLPRPPAASTLDLALGTTAASPLQLATAYQRWLAAPGSVGLSPAAVAFALQAMTRLPTVPGQGSAGGVAWKSGTSSGRRDAWSVGITEQHVVVVWLGNRSGHGEADLVGLRAANLLLQRVLALL